MNRPAPLSTYRLQLHRGFNFSQAAEIAGYLHQLGVSHVYSSPYLQAAPGSMHGYDVVDHSRVNEELGGAAAHERFQQVLGENDLGQVLDIVPNHMAIAGRMNTWWWDVLENGPASRYATYFDIEWDPPEEKLRNKVLMPILGDHYGRVLQAGQIQVVRRGGGFEVHYFEHELPVAPRSGARLLDDAAHRVKSDYLAFLASSLRRLPLPSSTDPIDSITRHRDKEVIRGLLARLCNERPDVAEAIDRAMDELNANVHRLDEMLEAQNYRLSFWKTAQRELGHRRFFDVNTLIGLRMELPQVFADTHRLLIEWIDKGVIDGLRVDHPDGLRDPDAYFAHLQEAAPKAWVIGEKILEPGETLPSSWKVAGTTGYDFLNVCGGLFVDPEGEDGMTALYQEFTGHSKNFEEVAHAKKVSVMRDVLGSDVNRLTALFLEICERDRNHRDYTRHEVHHAVREVAACFPVYRSYARAERHEISASDIGYIQQAIENARERRPDLDPELFTFIQCVLTLGKTGELETEFVMRFQQFTGPVMAKGVEDTAFYSYNRLVALNEVGGDPGRFGVTPDQFHEFCGRMQREHPYTMAASSTHDTKRSEDVRARLALLSEIPTFWREAVMRWNLATDRYRIGKLPDRNTQYLLYQTLIGAWPIDGERLKQYMQKACREAKDHTSWLEPREEFENAVAQYIDKILDDPEFRPDLEAFARKLVEPGRINSLAAAVLKVAAPGVPDTYQGAEIWDLSLVDPDNRRPVDYAARQQLLNELPGLSAEQIWKRCDEGLPKLFVLHEGLKLRRERPDSFGQGAAYAPVEAEGAKKKHIVAFRRAEDVVALAPRLVYTLAGDWGTSSIALPPGRWRNRFTGEEWDGRVGLAKILGRFPVALLAREDGR